MKIVQLQQPQSGRVSCSVPAWYVDSGSGFPPVVAPKWLDSALLVGLDASVNIIFLKFSVYLGHSELTCSAPMCRGQVLNSLSS